MQIPSLSALEHYITRLLTRGTEDQVFPGAAAAIITGHGRDRVRAKGTAGMSRLDRTGIAVSPATVFDLASLTKPLATALGILMLIDQGRLHPDDRLAELCSCPVPEDKADITLVHLLSHSSGLAPYRELFNNFPPDSGSAARQELITAILDAPLDYPVATEHKYSDLGYILLGDILERAAAMPLDIFFTRAIARPLGLEQEIFFLPLKLHHTTSRQSFAATENCPWRGRILQGEVHDEHAHLLGGVAGHAGLFGTAAGVGSLCAALLDGWQGRPSPLPISKKILARAFKPLHLETTWCLGFDTPSTGYTSAGQYLSRQSIGHLGYTGTSFWIDPTKDTILVLLTNRVHPDRDNKKIREFRPWFHDRVMAFLLGKE